MIGHPVELGVYLIGGGLLVDGAHHGDYQWLGAPGDPSEQVGHEVGAAPLPAGSAEDCGDGASESLMSVRYHQLHPAEAPGGLRLEALPSLHPFPARMAQEIALEWIPRSSGLTLLDPMCGSGAAVRTASYRGYESIGIDSDPLARLIARTAVSEFDEDRFYATVQEILSSASDALRHDLGLDVPSHASPETQKVMKFWFDESNRRQLTELSARIDRVNSSSLKDQLLVTMSRTIVTKKVGVSLGADISHSRPHRIYVQAPVRVLVAFEKESKALARILRKRTDGSWKGAGVTIIEGDARRLPLESDSVDKVVTSPPYLTGIDYMRGHKLSLIWMGYDIEQLARLRASNIGSELGQPVDNCSLVDTMADSLGDVNRLSRKMKLTLERYLGDISLVVSEISRVTKRGAIIVLVLGNANVGGVFLDIAGTTERLAAANALNRLSVATRQIPNNRRYLPPPDSQKEGEPLAKRLRDEVILVLKNEG